MNEPMSIWRWNMFGTWEAANNAILAVVPDMSVGIMDTGEGATMPAWMGKYITR